MPVDRTLRAEVDRSSMSEVIRVYRGNMLVWYHSAGEGPPPDDAPWFVVQALADSLRRERDPGAKR